MRKLVYPLLIIMLLACDPTVLFLEPQPEGKKDLKSFPATAMGTYMELDDSSIHIVAGSFVLERYEETIADIADDILEDEDIELIGENLHLKEMDLTFPVTLKNDSIFGHVVIYDTLINLLKGSKLRKLGRDYFLNQSNDSLWIVFKLNFEKSGYTYLCDIDHETEMEIFEKYSNVDTEKNDQGNPMKYFLSPTRKELKTLLKLETFTDSTIYIRLSQDFLR